MKLLARLIKILSGVQTGAEEEISRLEHGAHFCVLVWKSFVRNRCPVRAAALSFTTLLALIPMLAVAIGVTSSLLKKEGEQEIYEFIDKVVSNVMPPATFNANSGSAALNLSPGFSVPLTLANPPANTNALTASTNSETNQVTTPNAVTTGDSERVVTAQMEAAKWIHEFIQKTQSGTLGVVGMLLLVVVAIQMLANIEETFNDIWGVTRGRNWLSRIVLYWTTITLGPLLLAGALGLAGSPHFQATKGAVTGTLVGGFAFQLLPLVILWLAFALAYRLVPNTKIHFGAALVGGLVGGTLWHLNGVLGFLFVSRVASYAKVYGILGLVPVFMAGLYFSWLILLFGAQVAYAFQNRRSYLQDKLIENVNQRGREFIALRLMTCIGQRFQGGQPPVSLQKISVELGIPSRLVQQVVQTLLAARLVVETGGNEPGYAPARPLDTITAHDVLRALRTGAGQELLMRDGPVRVEVYGEFARIEKAERDAAEAITLLALVSRAETKLALAATEPEKQIAAAIENKFAEESPAPVSPAPATTTPVEIESEVVGPTKATISPAPKRTVTLPDEDREFPL
ncbi:MAG: YhjD/YihY/BrkB family envelope integrity protein [Verrucomicrobiales bacterium]|nr:YhjD/YihY/BrkB family envelope integrity protein [Verrucomicrobiales bacterium]